MPLISKKTVLAALLLGAAAAVSAADVPALEPAAADYLNELVDQARQRNLARDISWIRLLHYRRSLLGGWKSQVDGDSFFLSPKGKTQPAGELEATLRAFFQPAPADPQTLHPQCQFPARYAWLKSQLRFDPARLPEIRNARFEEWHARIDPGSVTAVFASSYLNNPASMYGHTFLRVNQAGRKTDEPLTDYCINFAADTPERSGVIFAAKGLLGAYPGRFTTTPYYMKVQQYNNIESRDLWEYTLSLTPEQTDRLARHLWEFGSTYFDYYFLTENCSYQLLPLLEVA
ncbi:MAG TPA: DUF4105 domain-containing protein, partial [Elusimicrobiota bacterium]|nr:DUF4105 domain-containing protein [Elusimicrobiota bacterium]